MSTNFLYTSLCIQNNNNTVPFKSTNTPHTDLIKYGVCPGESESNPSPNTTKLVSPVNSINSSELNICIVSSLLIYRIKENNKYEILVDKNNGNILSVEKHGFEDVKKFDFLSTISDPKISIDKVSYWTIKNKFIPAKN